MFQGNVGVRDWGTALQAGRSRFWFQMGSLDFWLNVLPWGRFSL